MFERVKKVCSGHQQLLSSLQINFYFSISFHLNRIVAFFSAQGWEGFVYQSIQSTTLSSPDQPLQLCPREVLGETCKLQQIHVLGHLLVLHHGACVNVNDLHTARLVGKANLYTDLRKTITLQLLFKPKTGTSSLPGLVRASSIMSGLLVIPMTRILFKVSTPSIFDNS